MNVASVVNGTEHAIHSLSEEFTKEEPRASFWQMQQAWAGPSRRHI